jgi:urea transport system substrate-binding protein
MFVGWWRRFREAKDESPNDPMEAAMIGFRMWTQAVAQAGTVDVNAVRQAMYGQRLAAPSGFEVVMHSNHMLSKPAMIAKVNDKGVFEVVWRSQSTITADVWSKYLPATARLTADWSFPWLCGGCAEPTIKD